MHHISTNVPLSPDHPQLDRRTQPAPFQSAVFGTVSHPSNILKEFLSLLAGVNKPKAMILSWLDGWMRSGKQWIYATSRALAKEFGYNHKTIHKHLKELVQAGILERRLAKRWPTDQAYSYRIQFERLLEVYWLDALRHLLKPLNQGTLSWLSQQWNMDVPELADEARQDWNIDIPQTAHSHNSSLSHSESAQHQDNLQCVCEKNSVLKKDIPPGTGFAAQNTETEQQAAEQIAKVNELIQEPLQPIRWSAVRGTVRKYPENLGGALMAVQQGLADGWMNNPTGYFLKALKEGIKPEAIGAESVVRMGRNQWWKLVGQQWGEEKRNQLILRVSDLGQGMSVYFANGLQMAFDQVHSMELEQVYALATQT